MKVIELNNASFEDCVKETVVSLKNNDLLIFPTDTVYGIGGKAFSRSVLEKLQKVKSNRSEKPTAILIDNMIRMSQCAGDVPSPKIVALAENFWPGALTMIWKTSAVIPEEFQTADKSLGYRIPDSAFLLQILREFELPIWATSANLPAQPPPRLFNEIKDVVLEGADLAVKTKDLLLGKASTVVDVRGREPIILREGAISEESIKAVWKRA